jgi:hypothetical protein
MSHPIVCVSEAGIIYFIYHVFPHFFYYIINFPFYEKVSEKRKNLESGQGCKKEKKMALEDFYMLCKALKKGV